MEQPIQQFDLSPRATNALRKAGLETVRDVADTGFEKLQLISGIGERIARQVKEVVFEKRALKD